MVDGRVYGEAEPNVSVQEKVLGTVGRAGGLPRGVDILVGLDKEWRLEQLQQEALKLSVCALKAKESRLNLAHVLEGGREGGRGGGRGGGREGGRRQAIVIARLWLINLLCPVQMRYVLAIALQKRCLATKRSEQQIDKVT